MNEIIVKRIKTARLERCLTQQDLADHLGRTAAAVSDLERGKVQVSASDLYKLAQFLNKPIEYFYGEEYGEKEIQDLIILVRKQSPEARKQTLTTVTMLLKLYEIGNTIQETSDKDKINIEQMTDFFNTFIPLSVMINEQAAQINDLRDKLIEELKIQGIDLASLLPNKK